MNILTGKTTSVQQQDDIFECKLILEDLTEYTIPIRKDGFIFATALCKVVGKSIGHFLKLKKTRDLITELYENSNVRNSMETYKGGNDKNKQGTWIHPVLGIQLAQWCSPNFEAQVSKWIKELTSTDNIELEEETNNNNDIQEEFEKLQKQLDVQMLLIKQLEIKNDYLKNDLKNELENKTKELENKTKELNHLQNKVNRQQKIEIDKGINVLYIITCDELEKDNIYLFGKAVDFSKRLSTYNKSLEYKVVYCKSFKNIYHMRTAEMMLLYKLNQYRDEKTLKDRFILPEDKEISLFTDVIDDIHHWFDDIENVVIDNTLSTEADKYLPRKERTYDKNSVYLLTSAIHLEKRMYIIGKSKNLNSRLSAYNKGFDHTVVYNKKCKNIGQMNLIELMILYKLDSLRERMNRDRFILPEGKDESFFIEIFDRAVNWFDDIDSTLEIVKDKETIEQERRDSEKIYRLENKEKIKERDKNYQEKNRNKLLVKQKIYRETHKEQVSAGKKEWYNKNKEQVIDRVKTNYENNKEDKIAKVKEYALKNKDKIKERQSIRITCECGATVNQYGLPKHKQTPKHILTMEQNI